MYLKVAQNGFWHSISKTMLLSEAWLGEFQLCIIRKHINHTSWNKYDVHCFRVLVCFLGHIVKAFQNNFAFIISTETCFWLKRVSDRTLAVFNSLETRFNTHNQIAIRNAFRNAFLELLRLSSISQYREYESRERLCHCGAALRNFIRNTIHLKAFQNSFAFITQYRSVFLAQTRIRSPFFPRFRKAFLTP